MKGDVTKYKKLLLAKKARLLAEVKHIEKDALKQSQRDAAGDLSGYSFHMADSATDNYDREFSLGLATNAQRILYEIEEALKRITEKRFGACLSCGKPIPKKRLTAVPYAKLCLPCQSSEEKQHRSAGVILPPATPSE
ncbi:MAG: TraR/DksA C4-type zinc finger protein [Candidatus Omnitrophica bacterium]|nr:TraR/DksA C4-type zinc finger protein [Candidatus Omnitrophota bacterium]